MGCASDLWRAANHVENAKPQQPPQPIVDHLERWHAAAHDAHLRCQIKGARLPGLRLIGRRRHGTGIDALEQCVDFVLVEYFCAHAYWITKLVK